MKEIGDFIHMAKNTRRPCLLTDVPDMKHENVQGYIEGFMIHMPRSTQYLVLWFLNLSNSKSFTLSGCREHFCHVLFNLRELLSIPSNECLRTVWKYSTIPFAF